MTLSLCICTVLHCSNRVLFIFYLSFTNRVIYLVCCFHVAPRSAVYNSVSLLTVKVSPLLMSFASASVFHHEYASTHAATLCAQVPYLCFALLLYIHSFVTGGSCSWLHLVHSRRWDGMEGGGCPGMLSITPQCFHVSCCFTVDSETL